MTKALGIGATVREARRRHLDPIAAVTEHEGGKILFRGKVRDVMRRTTEGYLRGSLRIEGLDEHRERDFRLAFQNEFVVGWIGEEVAAIVRDVVPDVVVTCSHDLGRIGLLGHENVTLLNAGLGDLAARTTRAFADGLAKSGLDARLFVTRNDGTVMAAEYALRFPVLSFASGPTNSLRGAAILAGIENAIGAATAQVSGEVDQVFQNLGRDEALARAKEVACTRARAAGARESTLSVTEVEDLPLAYLPGDSLRVRVRVTGDIS